MGRNASLHTQWLFLCDQPVPPRNIESIVVYHWDELQEGWIGEFLYVQALENKKIRSFTGKKTYSAESIAATLVMHEKDPVVREQKMCSVMADCHDQEALRTHLKAARMTPLSKWEEGKRKDLTVRRCPACLQANFVACTK